MSHLAVGLFSVALGLWGMASWWSIFGLVMRGVIPFFLLLFGIVAILAACRRLSFSEPVAVPVHPGAGVQSTDTHGTQDAYDADDILGT